MKKILDVLWGILDEAHKELKNKLLFPPVVVAAIISGAVTIGSKIVGDIKAKKATAKADAEAVIEKAENAKIADRGVNAAKAIAKQGDPSEAGKLRQIEENAANVVGKAVATSTSSQEIINAAGNVNKQKNKAENLVKTQAGEFKNNANKLVAAKFGESAQLRLGGNQAIDNRLANAVAAIGANNQAFTDTVQNIGKLGTDVVGATKWGQGGATPVTG